MWVSIYTTQADIQKQRQQLDEASLLRLQLEGKLVALQQKVEEHAGYIHELCGYLLIFKILR